MPYKAYQTLLYTLLPNTVTFGVSCYIWPCSDWIFFPINHLQNLSSYENVYGHKLLTITDLQLEVDNLTRPTFYCFSDYLDLLN